MNKRDLFLLLTSSVLVCGCQSDKKEDAKEFYSDLFDKQEESAEFALTDEEVSGEVQEEVQSVAEVQPAVVTPAVIEAKVEVPKVETVAEVEKVVPEEKKEFPSAVDPSNEDSLNQIEESPEVGEPGIEDRNN